LTLDIIDDGGENNNTHGQQKEKKKRTKERTKESTLSMAWSPYGIPADMFFAALCVFVLRVYLRATMNSACVTSGKHGRKNFVQFFSLFFFFFFFFFFATHGRWGGLFAEKFTPSPKNEVAEVSGFVGLAILEVSVL
jgi:hypothetical protein